MNPIPLPLITANPNILLGKPTIVGTRITVELILEKLAAGESIDQILESHPRLTRESIPDFSPGLEKRGSKTARIQ